MSMGSLVSQLVSILEERFRAFIFGGFGQQRRNFFACIAIFLCAWAGWLYWLARVIERHGHISGGEWFGLFDVLFLICCFQAIFFGSRGGEMKEVFHFLIVPCLMLPFLLLVVAIWRIVTLHVFLFAAFEKICRVRLPRYRQSTHKDKLCSMCEHLVDQSSLLIGTKKLLVLPTEDHYHYSAKDLQESARNCHMCNILLRSVETFRTSLSSLGSCPNRLSDEQGESLSYNSSNPGDKLFVRVWEKKPLGERPLLRIQLLGHDITKSVPLNIEEVNTEPGRHHGTPSSITNSLADMNLVRQWIESCCRNHSICQGNFQSNFNLNNERDSRPARLLDVGQIGSPHLRLVDTAELSITVTGSFKYYCALSHRWGDIMEMRLLQNNYQNMLQSIDFAQMPKTFQHAVSVTREIGAGYLWIDSLCIVQDSAEDWLRESPKMGHIYAKALCTISATSSSNSDGGCFFPKDPFLSDCVLRTENDRSLTIRSSIRDDATLEKVFNQKIEHAPLTTRAWTFQERVLSPRILHFCDGLVLFECNTLRASEFHIEGMPYPRKTNVRSDGKLHDAAELQRLNLKESEYRQVTEQIWVQGISTRPVSRPARSRYVPRTTTQPNPDYKSRQDKIDEILRISAQAGMRGAFEFLLRFKGEELAEKIEFHQSWYEMVEEYSVRDLTKHTDKMMAIAGVAYFVQMSTSLRYVAGLWMETLLFNLLWAVVGTPKARPDRRVPTWSWASVDGRINHRLIAYSAQNPDNLQSSKLSSTASKISARTPDTTAFKTTWEHIEPLICDESVQLESNVNPLISNAVLQLSCKLFKFDSSKINFAPDTAIEYPPEELVCLPVLSFKNSFVHPVGSPWQLHGIVLRTRQCETEEYERVGYFWTAKNSQNLLDEILDGPSMGNGEKYTIRIV